VIEIRGLSKRFGTVLAVDDITFAVGTGQVIGFLGPNGAGKTTTLRMLLGLVTPTAGTATINGHAYRDLPDPLHAVGAVLEASSCHPGRTARNHLRIHALAGHADPPRIDEVLRLVDLRSAADRRVGGYSLGMRQRLALATALLHKPAVLILDEPANGLDPEGVRWLRELLRGLADDGSTVLVSSHILAEVAQTVDSIVILDHGRLITHSSLADLVADIVPLVRVRTPRADELAKVLENDGASATATDREWLDVSGSSPERIGMLAAEHAIPIFETKVESADLEDIFFQLTAGTSGKQASR
jgi:ABC-2 type transport system ATP-binding protein